MRPTTRIDWLEESTCLITPRQSNLYDSRGLVQRPAIDNSYVSIPRLAAGWAVCGEGVCSQLQQAAALSQHPRTNPHTAQSIKRTFILINSVSLIDSFSLSQTQRFGKQSIVLRLFIEMAVGVGEIGLCGAGYRPVRRARADERQTHPVNAGQPIRLQRESQ